MGLNDYEGAIRDISILPSSSRQKGEPLTEAEQFTLRPELGKLMRIARIARPGALYDDSVSAQTFETIDESIINPIGVAEGGDVNIARVVDVDSYSRIPGFEDFDMNFKRM